MTFSLGDTPVDIARDLAAVSRLSAVPVLLRLLCSNTGMGFAAVARVTEGSWTACAVQDNIGFGLGVGGQLDIETTLCRESRAMRQPIVIDDASVDPVYREHHTPRIYGLRSYISVPIICSDGQYFGNLCAIDPKPAVLSNPQTLAMFTAYAELIGNQLEHEDRREKSASELEVQRRRGDLLEEFIAVLGHDLRNPLQAIEASAEVILRAREASDPRPAAKRIKNSTRRMSKLIDDVLDFTRGRLGATLPVHMASELELGPALESVIEEIQSAHPTRVIVSEVDIDGAVICDRHRVEQLVSNLVGNAVHHGAPDTPIFVNASVAEGQLRFAVLNGGAPIEAAHLSRIFEPYWRPATSQPGGGLGLGLHICSQIVAAHDGRLEVTSSAERGTQFVALLPMHGGTVLPSS